MSPKGSIILKIIIVLLLVGLYLVLTIPDGLWKEEDAVREKSKSNMTALYDAQKYYYSKTQSFVPSDSLEKLLTFIANDADLARRREIGALTEDLNNALGGVLDVDVMQSILPMLQGIDEIKGDLTYNNRYLARYDGSGDGPNLMAAKDEIATALESFQEGSTHPNFHTVQTYVDSVNYLRERLNDYPLTEAVTLGQHYVDSLSAYIGDVEVSEVAKEWGSLYDKIAAFVKMIKATDVVSVSNIADRLPKFNDQVRTAVTKLSGVNLSQGASSLAAKSQALAALGEKFGTEAMADLAKEEGLLQLSEVDSTLLNLSKDNFFDPDTYDGEQRYIMAYRPGNSYLVVESPNLLGQFGDKVRNATKPLVNLSLYDGLNGVYTALDSSKSEMTSVKDRYRLGRYNTDIILTMKEVIAEMDNLGSVKFVRYANDLKEFVDTVQTTSRLSVVKPMVENLVQKADTLASRLESRDVSDLMERLTYFGGKIQKLDSLIQNSNIPARVRSNIKPFSTQYQDVFGALESLKGSLNPGDAGKIRTAIHEVFQDVEEVLNGYPEKVAVVFEKMHENHGFIENGIKSWETSE